MRKFTDKEFAVFLSLRDIDLICYEGPYTEGGAYDACPKVWMISDTRVWPIAFEKGRRIKLPQVLPGTKLMGHAHGLMQMFYGSQFVVDNNSSIFRGTPSEAGLQIMAEVQEVARGFGSSVMSALRQRLENRYYASVMNLTTSASKSII